MPFGLRLGGELTRASSITETYRTEEFPEKYYIELEKHLVENDQVLLDLEDVDNETPRIQEAEDLFEQLSGLGVELSEEIRQNFIQQERESIARRKLDELAHASGFVLLLGTFFVKSEAIEDHYLLVFEHPLNQLLQSLDKRASISLIIPKNRFALVNQEMTNSVDATLFGRIVGWNGETWTLQVTPFAVY